MEPCSVHSKEDLPQPFSTRSPAAGCSSSGQPSIISPPTEASTSTAAVRRVTGTAGEDQQEEDQQNATSVVPARRARV